jgi:hypothetical protein
MIRKLKLQHVWPPGSGTLRNEVAVKACIGGFARPNEAGLEERARTHGLFGCAVRADCCLLETVRRAGLDIVLPPRLAVLHCMQ